MSHFVNTVALDNMAEKVQALEEVLKPSAYEAFRAHLEHLISNGEREQAEEDLRQMEDSQDVR